MHYAQDAILTAFNNRVRLLGKDAASAVREVWLFSCEVASDMSVDGRRLAMSFPEELHGVIRKCVIVILTVPVYLPFLQYFTLCKFADRLFCIAE